MDEGYSPCNHSFLFFRMRRPLDCTIERRGQQVARADAEGFCRKITFETIGLAVNPTLPAKQRPVHVDFFHRRIVEVMFEIATKERNQPKGKKVYKAWSYSERAMLNSRHSMCDVQNFIYTK